VKDMEAKPDTTDKTAMGMAKILSATTMARIERMLKNYIRTKGALSTAGRLRTHFNVLALI